MNDYMIHITSIELNKKLVKYEMYLSYINWNNQYFQLLFQFLKSIIPTNSLISNNLETNFYFIFLTIFWKIFQKKMIFRQKYQISSNLIKYLIKKHYLTRFGESQQIFGMFDQKTFWWVVKKICHKSIWQIF